MYLLHFTRSLMCMCMQCMRHTASLCSGAIDVTRQLVAPTMWMRHQCGAALHTFSDALPDAPRIHCMHGALQ